MTEPAPAALWQRYRPEHLRCFTSQEWDRFVGPYAEDARRALEGEAEAWARVAPELAWELLYRLEPELYARLVSGEHIHHQVIERLGEVGTAVELAAGCGRLTLELAPKCTKLVAIEPAEPLRRMLGGELQKHGLGHVEVACGFFDSVPVPDAVADLVVSASAFTSDPAHGGESGLAEMERIAKPGGTIALVWPANLGWLLERGFTYVRFSGDMRVDFGTPGEAVEMAGIFYPRALEEIALHGHACVPYEVLGINPPCDIALKRAE